MPNLLQPPEGWTRTRAISATRPGIVERDPDIPLNRENVEERFTALRDWATANGLQLEPKDYSLVEYAQYLDIFCWTKFEIRRSDNADNHAVIASFACTGCGHDLRVGQVYCERCDRFVVCDTCHLAGLRLYGVRGQEGNGACPACSVECATGTCRNRLPRQEGWDKCADCDPRAGCAHCGQLAPIAQLVEHTHKPPNGLANAQGKFFICPKCVDSVCVECHGHFDNTQDRTIANKTFHICDECAQVRYDKERAQFEKWNEDELPVSGSLMIPGTGSRPIRTVSIETEFDGDGVKVGRALASAGLLPAPERIPRHREEGKQADRYPCLLKSDGSVTGGELVTYLIDLDNDNHAAALLRMTEVMRGCREMGQAQFTQRAGGHIHIDLHGLSAKDLWAQYTVFNYLQQVIFYLAGAGAEYGHRTLSGSGYTNAGPVGPFGTVGKFAQSVLGGGERWALHFGNFNHAKGRCQCGAYITGEWGDCTCNLGKATAEWRVWNAEINPRILHAWLAFMQAVVAYSTDLDGFNEAEFPPLVWTKQHFKNTTSGQRKELKDRIEWIFTNLPLTLHERDSLIYALKKSELVGLGEDYLNGLLDIEPDNEFGNKKPAKNHNSRKGIKFELAGVAGAGVDARNVHDFYAGEDDDDEDDDYDDGDGW